MCYMLGLDGPAILREHVSVHDGMALEPLGYPRG
jgi:hypothetical protein